MAIGSGIAPSASRTPHSTATIATEIVANNSSAAEDKNAIRSVRIVATRCSCETPRIVPSCRSPRP